MKNYDELDRDFRNWVEHVGVNGIIIDAVVAEADYDEDHYELSGSATKTGIPSVFEFTGY